MTIDRLYALWRACIAASDGTGADDVTAELRKRGVRRWPWGELEPDEKKRRLDNEHRAAAYRGTQNLFSGNGKRRKARKGTS